MAQDKLAYIQEGDQACYYGGIKNPDGSRNKYDGVVVGIQDIDGVHRLLVKDGVTISVKLENVFERSRVIPSEGTSTHYFEGPGSEE